jgi:hypothetical protein
VLTPFEVVFHCFSAELAGVLDGFANSPRGFVVKSINVQPGALAPTAETAGTSPGAGFPGMVSAPTPPTPPAAKGALPVLVDEKQLKVTLALDLVKLLAKK